MKRLQCEMCGNTDLIKQDGVYVCQFCGAKYSVEEAKKLMIEGVVDVSGSTVKIDESDRVANYYNMAESAYQSNNIKEAEQYCNKIIEIDPQNYKAWLLKGKAAGWLSTLGNIRLEETVNCFTKAIEYAPDFDKEEIKTDSSSEVENITKTIIKMCCDNYAKLPIKENSEEIISNIKLGKLYSSVLLSKCGIPADGFRTYVVDCVCQAVYKACTDIIFKEYTDSAFPSKYDFERFVERGTAAVKLLETAIDIYDGDKQENITRYEWMILITQKIVKSAGYIYDGFRSKYVVESQLTKEAKQYNNDMIKKWEQAIKEIDPNYDLRKEKTLKDSFNPMKLNKYWNLGLGIISLALAFYMILLAQLLYAGLFLIGAILHIFWFFYKLIRKI